MSDGIPDVLIRVLIVDDHEMLAESLVRLLEEDPRISVIGTAATATEGIARASAELPDVIVMDYLLPDMTGAEATRLLRAAQPQIKVISLTGSDQPGAYQAMVDAGSSAWVRKTQAVRDLRSAVHAVHAGHEVADDELVLLPTRAEIGVHYQPVVDLETERIVGFEALARWNHPTQGVLPPSTFLPAAEQTGFIHEIGQVVASTAIAQLVEWHDANRTHDLRMSVNVSASGLGRVDTARELADALTEAGLRPDQLVLEITETVLLDDTDEVQASLTRLKEIGVLLALDDFGTAFSSLSYLRRFPFDEIKLDTSFTAELPGSARSMLVVEAVVQLADSLGMPLVAEGIERPDQAECLRAFGCRFGQGYLYSRPVPAHAASDLLGI